MGGYKTQRIAEDMKREISGIISQMKDPRLKKGFISVIRVEVSNDLSFAKVYISSMGGIDGANEAVKSLENASGYIRKTLSSHLRMRKCPALRFIPDDSIAFGAHINRILTELHQKEENQNGEQ